MPRRSFAAVCLAACALAAAAPAGAATRNWWQVAQTTQGGDTMTAYADAASVKRDGTHRSLRVGGTATTPEGDRLVSAATYEVDCAAGADAYRATGVHGFLNDVPIGTQPDVSGKVEAGSPEAGIRDFACGPARTEYQNGLLDFPF